MHPHVLYTYTTVKWVSLSFVTDITLYIDDMFLGSIWLLCVCTSIYVRESLYILAIM